MLELGLRLSLSGSTRLVDLVYYCSPYAPIRVLRVLLFVRDHLLLVKFEDDINLLADALCPRWTPISCCAWAAIAGKSVDYLRDCLSGVFPGTLPWA